MDQNDKIKEKTKYPKIFLLDNGGRPMWIKDIHIQGVGGIIDLALEFKPGLNVICGANGIGKTTILNCINEFFIMGNSIKRNANCDEGFVSMNYDFEGNHIELQHKTSDFLPENNKYYAMQDRQLNDRNYVLNFGSNRDIEYRSLKQVSRDPNGDYKDSKGVFVSEVDIKNWFVNRFAFVDKKDSTSEEKIANYKLAVENFSVIDRNITFHTVKGSTYDIMLNTPNGEIYFEYLSSGYKTCIYIVLGIIKEIEYRLKEKSVMVYDFAGVILIDEIDIHLHPVWQAKLLRALKKVFPKCQVIATTHSPSILQTLEADEIIALDTDENWNVYKKDLQLGEYGLKGWTLEEILTDVMGLSSTNSVEFEDAINNFDSAMDSEDYESIKSAYDKLDKMLHPKSTLRKLLQIQMAGMGE